MPIPLLMPALSPTMTEGTLVRWLKEEGQLVKSGEVLAEIETDKATMEIEAVDEGTLGKILIPAGTVGVKVNTTIGLILEEDESSEALNLEGFSEVKGPSDITSPRAALPSPASRGEQSSLSCGGETPRIFASPLARRLAHEASLSLESIQGSGPKGRIVKKDVEAMVRQDGNQASFVGQVPPPLPQALFPTPASITPSQGTFSSSEISFTDIPLTGMRKVIAQRLTQSKQTIPHFYLTVDCHLDALLSLRSQLNTLSFSQPEEPTKILKISVNDFIIRACGLALAAVPEANVCWMDSVLRQFHQSDVSVAVSLEGGLVTPVIRHAEKKSLKIIALEMKELARQAREGKLPPEAYQGGTFTLSNLGMYGIQNFSAIINPPQACILAVGKGEKRPVIQEDRLGIATMMTCTLSADHRAVDGAVAARFLASLKGLIEDPLQILL